MHHPFKTWLFLLFSILLISIIGIVFPTNGVQITSSFNLKFPNPIDLLKTKESHKNITSIISTADSLDKIKPIITNNLKKDSSIITLDTLKPKPNSKLEYTSIKSLQNFFEALRNLKSVPYAIRVLHYGDSQIEGDRITDYLRLKLQGQFGGGGPGLISFMPISQSVTNKIIYSDNWDRYGVFTAKDKRVSHSNYGIMAGFNRFLPYKKINDSSSATTSYVKISTTKNAGTNNLNYHKIKLFYGGSQAKTWCEFYDGPALISADSLTAGGIFNLKEYNVGNESYTHQFNFSGKDSPDFYALSLESEYGVIVDNIGLRGSSGTFFHQINFNQLKQFYDYLNVKLIILQFGGNAMPQIKDAANAHNYAEYIRSQISLVKKAAPNASVIFIGPADMSIKEETSYITYPILESVRDNLKKVVLESGCAYFDMYECMGGKNSMPSWVEQNLAASDYIHFSPQGARKIATLFYASLITEYNNYLTIRK